MLLAVRPLDKGDDKHDPALVGNWRSKQPVGQEDKSEVFEFRFDKKGKAMLFHVQYEWVDSLQSWEASAADQPAQGDNDVWETENGFMTFQIRERYVRNRDLVVRYLIDGDTLRLWMAEIYRRQNADGEGLWGAWRMETYDQSYPEEKRVREFLLEKNGIMREKVNGKGYAGKIIPTNGGWQQLRTSQVSHGETVTDTLFQPYICEGNNLYLYQKDVWLTLFKR